MRRMVRGFAPVAILAVPLIYAAVHLLLPPRAHNSHAIMYPLVLEHGASNSLEVFHPLYVPMLLAVKTAAVWVGLKDRLLLLYQLVSLAGAMAHLVLVYALALEVLGERRLALIAAALATASVNLWAWSLQTMPYTWATAAMLGCMLVLLRGPAGSLRAAALLGGLTGLAVGLDLACAAMAPAALVELWLGPRRGKAVACYLSCTALAAAAAYVPFLTLGRTLPAGFSALVEGLPRDMAPVYRTASLWAQARALLSSPAPEDAPLWLLVLFFGALAWRGRALPGSQRRAARVAAVLFAAMTGFFLLNDPHNRFVYAGGLLFPVLAAMVLSRSRRPAAACALVWAVLAGKNLVWPADYLPPSNPGFDEARFVSSRLDGKDLIVALSQPDWLFAYGLGDRVPMVRVSWREETGRVGEALHMGEPLKARLRSVLCGGGRVLLASDWLFRDRAIPEGRIAEGISELVVGLKKDFDLGPAVVSPGGLHYYPIWLASRSRGACR